MNCLKLTDVLKLNFRKINRFIVLFSLGMLIYISTLSCMNRTSSAHAVTFLLSQSFKERRPD
jgi:hypothetical protein